MAKMSVGYKIGIEGKLGVGCSASVIDPITNKVLLIQRTDNAKWAVPGGYMEPGESFSKACSSIT